MFETLSIIGIHNSAELASYLCGLLICTAGLAFFFRSVRHNTAPATQELTAEQFEALRTELRAVVAFDDERHDLVKLMSRPQRLLMLGYEWELMVRVSKSAQCTDDDRFLVGKYCEHHQRPHEFSGFPVIEWGWFHSQRARRNVKA